MSAKVLVVDDPMRPEWGTTTAPYVPWNPALSRKAWDFDSADIALLEEGKTLFRGDVAFFLEDDDE
jgi:hypothetical protein